MAGCKRPRHESADETPPLAWIKVHLAPAQTACHKCWWCNAGWRSQHRWCRAQSGGQCNGGTIAAEADAKGVFGEICRRTAMSLTGLLGAVCQRWSGGEGRGRATGWHRESDNTHKMSSRWRVHPMTLLAELTEQGRPPRCRSPRARRTLTTDTAAHDLQAMTGHLIRKVLVVKSRVQVEFRTRPTTARLPSLQSYGLFYPRLRALSSIARPRYFRLPTSCDHFLSP